MILFVLHDHNLALPGAHSLTATIVLTLYTGKQKLKNVKCLAPKSHPSCDSAMTFILDSWSLNLASVYAETSHLSASDESYQKWRITQAKKLKLLISVL